MSNNADTRFPYVRSAIIFAVGLRVLPERRGAASSGTTSGRIFEVR